MKKVKKTCLKIQKRLRVMSEFKIGDEVRIKPDYQTPCKDIEKLKSFKGIVVDNFIGAMRPITIIDIADKYNLAIDTNILQNWNSKI